MTPIPQSPFLTSACVHQAEALPVAVSGTNHPAAGSSIDYEKMFDAIFDAALPPVPPPIFLRKPSQAFMRALFELSR